jgi:hypothetical protein
MAINTLNELINLDTLVTALDAGVTQPFFIETRNMEAASVLHSTFRMRGAPGSGALQTAGINGANRTGNTSDETLPHPNAGGVANGMYLTNFHVTASQPGTLILCDRLWDQNGLVVTQTTVQNVAYPALPARDRNGATTGTGVFAILEVTANTTSTAVTNMTIRVDPVGAEGAVNLPVRTFPNSAVNNVTVIGVANSTSTNVYSGMTGCNGVTLGTSLGAGAVNLACIRPIAMASVPIASVGTNLDAFDLGLPRIYDNSSLFFLWLTTTAANTQIYGVAKFSEGPFLTGNTAFLPPVFTYGFLATAANTAGMPHSTRRSQQWPSKGTAETQPANLQGAVINTSHIPFTNPSGANSAYLAGVTWAQSVLGTVSIVDRLWHSGNLATSTGAQTVNSVTLPTRDVNGSSNGHGVGVAVYFQTGMGANTALATIEYTNSDGVGTRTGYMQRQSASFFGGIAGIATFTLQQGDKGVRSIQNFNWGGNVTSGTAHLLMYRTIARIDLPSINASVTRNFAELGLPKLYSNTSLEFWIATDVAGTLDWYGVLNFATG